MCGIAGYVDGRGTSGVSRSRLDAALLQLGHRGPDGRGTWFSALPEGEIGIGHTRLSIIDLSVRGRQPMHSEPERYVLSFNGEIYNYLELREELAQLGEVFSSNSDTEVLLAAWKRWGVACLPKLNGMFAFAIYDARDRVLFLARDRYGIKPVYFGKQDRFIVFASEPQTVAGLLGQTAPNHQKVYEYLTMGLYDLDERTFFDGVFALDPGHVATIACERGRVSFISRRWSDSDPPERVDIDFDHAVTSVRRLFLESINLHLRSNVPVAVALSGGVDSSGIVGAVRHLYPNREIHTFGYSSPGFVKDESEWANLVSTELGTIHHHVNVSSTDALEELSSIVRKQGEPTNSSSVIAQSLLYRSVSQNGFKVLLDGQGADELFAGYLGFPEFRLRSLVSQGKWGEAASLVLGWKNASPDRSLLRLATHFAATHVEGDLAGLGGRVLGRGAFPGWVDSKRLREYGVIPGVPPSLEGYPAKVASESRFLQQHLFRTLHGGDIRRLLRHGDRSSMSNSVESRVPYLENHLVKFVNSLPESFLLSQKGETKHLLRAALSGLAPRAVLERKDKIGFETPESVWLGMGTKVSDGYKTAVDYFPWLVQNQPPPLALGSSTPVNWRFFSLAKWAEEFL